MLVCPLVQAVSKKSENFFQLDVFFVVFGMPRKKRKPVCSNDKRKGKKVKRKTKKQKLIEKLIVGSEWRVATGDTEITSTGKEVMSG